MDYPLTLSYTCSTGQIDITIVCDNEEQADEAFECMFQLCGNDVAYSVD